jgi:membrane protein DedA with SNARE-associated domain
MTLFGAVAAGVLGNVVGSWIAYFIGLWGGRELWVRYARYVGCASTT